MHGYSQRLYIVRIALLFTVFLSFGTSSGQTVMISEFMALNTDSFEDDDGDCSDWIELYNPTDAPVDLTGWSLSDDVELLTKWKFPAVQIEAGQFLVVFASDKNRRNPAYALHTNFKLYGSGEFLGLTAADETTIVSSFTQFPPQVEDVSYGYTQESQTEVLIGAEAAAAAFVPSDDSLGLSWTGASFSDASWSHGQTGVGYERNSGYESLINLDLLSDMEGINCTAYIRIPFTVSDATKTGSLTLRMKYDDGFIAYINGHEVAGRHAPASPAWNSEATSNYNDASAVVFEDIPLFNTSDYLIDGENVLAIHGLNDNIGSSDFLIIPELHAHWASEITTENPLYLETPTPGMPNTPGATSVSGTPGYSRESGTYTSTFYLSISTEAPDAEIRYTLNWEEPTAESPLYTLPIHIDENTMVRARVFEPDAIPGRVVTRSFTLLDSNTRDFSSNLPLIVLNTYGGSINGNTYTGGYAEFYEPGENGRTRLEDGSTVNTIVGLKYRGSSSSGFPKRMFAMETWDERGNDKDTTLFGLSTESDWVLNGPYSDKSLIRNVLSYRWSNEIGTYAPRTKLVEVFLNTGGGRLAEAHYHGVYVLIEKIKRDDERVDIKELLPSQDAEPEISGGYILKIDRLDPGDQGFTTSSGVTVCYVEPKEEEITAPQRQWIKSYLDNFEAALYSSSFTNPEIGYAAYIDEAAWVDHFLMVEFMRNIDGYRLSTFFHKDRGGKLAMGPIWDYNLSLGNANYLSGWIPEGWYLDDANWSWWVRLFEQSPRFKQMFVDRWSSLRKTVFDKAKLLATVDETAAYLDEAQRRNFSRWQILGKYVWPNWFIADTYREEIDFLKDWLSDRVDWIDAFCGPVPEFNQNGGLVESGFPVTMTCPSCIIYYTLDGTDPRLDNGLIAPGARRYTSPIEITENSQVKARSKNGSNWSGLSEATFIVDPLTLVLSEIMYHPPVSENPESLWDDNDYEFVELFNCGNNAIDLSGARFTDAIEFTFPEGLVLDPGRHIVVVKNLQAFTERYGATEITIAGTYTGSLENLGEAIAFEGPRGEPVFEFTYDDLWYSETDGGGYSLVPENAYDPYCNWNLAESWRPSIAPLGSPGREDSEVTGGWQLPGDVNQDGAVDISDAIATLLILFGNAGGALPCEGDTTVTGGNLTVLDINASGSFDIADAISLLSYLFAGGPPPALGTECIRVEGCASACWP